MRSLVWVGGLLQAGSAGIARRKMASTRVAGARAIRTISWPPCWRGDGGGSESPFTARAIIPRYIPRSFPRAWPCGSASSKR